MSSVILSIDQGTTSSRTVVFSLDGDILFSAQEEFPQIYPQDGWVEHDPEAIWNTVLSTLKQAYAFTVDAATTPRLLVSQISARQRLSGTVRRASRFIMRLSGRTAARLRIVKSSQGKCLSRNCAQRQGYCMTLISCLLYTSPSPRDATLSRMPSSA